MVRPVLLSLLLCSPACLPPSAVCTARYADGDGDGAVSAVGIQSCDPSDGDTAPGEDCDDDDVAVHPGAVETCGDEGVDNDCDASTEVQDATQTWYGDGDGDGYGDAAVTRTTEGCDAEPPTGYVENADDCDDADGTAYPGGTDAVCSDGVDGDCDGQEACALDGAMVVTALLAGGGWQRAGTAVAVFGVGRVAVGDPGADEVAVLDGVTGEVQDTITGDGGTEFGASVAVGDFDGDGEEDVAVGAPGAAGVWRGPDFDDTSTIALEADYTAVGPLVTLRQGSGAATLAVSISYTGGGKTYYDVALLSDPSSALSTEAAPRAGSFVVNTAWPLTLSGAPDGSALAVGYSGVTGTTTGAAVYGVPLSDPVSTELTFTNASAELLLGAAVGCADLDSSGTLDLLVGAPGAGKVLGLVDPAVGEDPYGVSDASLTWTGPAALSFGASLGLVGDLDGDGDTEFAIGGEGTLWIFFRDSDGGFALSADEASATVTGFTGVVRALLNAGDVNADGYDDLVVSDDANVTLLLGGP